MLARMRKGGAGALIASAFLMPLAACAVQPAATNAPVPAASQPATQAPTPVPTQAATPAPAARQQDGATAGQQGDAPQAATAPQRTTSRPAASPPVTPNTPVAERATTVGEVPTVGAATPTPTPGVATMPGAPAAVPGTPANPNTPVTVGQSAPGPSTGTLLQTILALVLVLALLAGLAWAAKRYGPRVAGNSANLRMVGALNIGGRERIMVVEVGDQWIVVGASPGRVNALATMPKGDAAASATLAGHAPSANSFSDWLKQTIDKRNAK
ncbi:flagellar biosynthetic protein FliO [Massilia suwonensis]|uniref:Flagellar protein n=1 Tax=Massilia suwonensis TaxID=648895 RepID=A0ABW0MNE5_9BURK